MAQNYICVPITQKKKKEIKKNTFSQIVIYYVILLYQHATYAIDIDMLERPEIYMNFVKRKKKMVRRKYMYMLRVCFKLLYICYIFVNAINITLINIVCVNKT